MDFLPRLRNRIPLFEHSGRNYVVMHCTGYVKCTPPLGIQQTGNPNACLVAIARLQLSSLGTQIASNLRQFTLRADKEGYITFVDGKVKELLNKQPDELLEKRLWTIVHPLDEQLINDTFKNVIQNNNQQQVKVKM